MSERPMSEPVPDAPEKTPVFRRLAPILLIAVGLVLFFAFDLHRYFSLDALKTHRQQLLDIYAANPALTMAVFFSVYAGLVALSFPGASVLTLLAGFLFGTWVARRGGAGAGARGGGGGSRCPTG
ncbi:MAG: hypothetical protein VW268_07225, partial [Rhodospirillaceae bacterium]